MMMLDVTLASKTPFYEPYCAMLIRSFFIVMLIVRLMSSCPRARLDKDDIDDVNFDCDVDVILSFKTNVVTSQVVPKSLLIM